MREYSFEKLNIWNDVRELIKDMYQITSKYPDTEKFGLVNQMRRAMISVSSNIAEGSSRTGKKDQAHFYQMAFSSLIEVLSQLIVSKDLSIIDEEEYIVIRSKIENLAPRIGSLRNYQLSKR